MKFQVILVIFVSSFINCLTVGKVTANADIQVRY